MARITSPTGKPIILKPVHPNSGIAQAYAKRLDRLVSEMHASLVYWLSAAYRANPPEMAQDASPAAVLQQTMAGLARRWNKRFRVAAADLADYFATATAERADGALTSILSKAGFKVEFSMTAEAQDVMTATINEQIGLIRSISQQHLSQVEGLVMRSVSQGRDLGYLVKELEARYAITKRRAVLIARDQNNKATAAMLRARQDALGITQAQWVHSGGGKHPRPEHEDAGRKKLIYDVMKGAYLDGKWVWPGTEISCRCVSRPIIPGVTDL